MKSSQSDPACDILKLFNLDQKNVDRFYVSHQPDGIFVDVTLFPKAHKCPVCGSLTTSIKDYVTKRITHSALTTSSCFIQYRARRYICTFCRKSFFEHNPFTLSGMKVSLLTVYNVLNDLKSPTETFTSIANRYHISPTTAATIFDRYIQIPRRTLPEVICIDEVYAFRSENSKYVCVLLDYISQNVIDLLPSRQLKDLSDYFYKIPLEERRNVKLVSIDMWKSYRQLVHIYLPSASVAVDKFHIFQELGRRLNRVRIDAMNSFYVKQVNEKTLPPEKVAEYRHKKELYYVFKKFDWLLFLNNDDLLDHNREKKFNKALNRYCNYKDLLDCMLDNSLELNEAYQLYYQLQRFYESKEKLVKANMNSLIQAFKESNLPIMNQFADTLIQWKTEIINSFITIPAVKKKVTNAIIENRNKVIKTLKRNSNGYTNWDRFRNRALYSINKDATYHIYPLADKENDQDFSS